jgi:hypothetical protein
VLFVLPGQCCTKQASELGSLYAQHDQIDTSFLLLDDFPAI